MKGQKVINVYKTYAYNSILGGREGEDMRYYIGNGYRTSASCMKTREIYDYRGQLRFSALTIHAVFRGAPD